MTYQDLSKPSISRVPAGGGLRNLLGITSKREMVEATEQTYIYYLAKVTKSVTLAKRYINGWEICMDKNSYLS